MNIKKSWIIFACFLLLPLASGCGGGSSQKAPNLILYSITERTENLDDIATGVYVVNEKDGNPQKIYEVQAPQQLRVMFAPDGSKVIVFTWHLVEKPDSAIPGVSYTLVTMDVDGENEVTWFTDKDARYIACTFSAQFSADGKRFLYITPASEDCQEYRLYAANSDGKDEKLIDQASSIKAEFSPKGDRLLVSCQFRDVANKRTTSEVYLVNLKGGESEVFWSNEEAGIIASATYGGSDRVLLEVGSFLDAEIEISIMSANLKEKTPVAKFTGTHTTALALSKDAKYIGLGRQGENCIIFSVIDVSTAEIRDISCWNTYPFQFAANGEYLLAGALGSYGDFSSIGINHMLLKPNGDLIETLSPPDYIHSTLSPDGNRLAYWVRDPDTKEMCLNIRDLETDEVTLSSRTCVSGATNYPGITYWK